MPVEITLTNEQEVDATLTPVTATGKPATLAGVPTWTVTSGESTITVAADGLSAVVRSSDTVGDTVIAISGDPGGGAPPITDTLTVHVTSAAAVSLGLAAGTPRPKT